MLCLNRKKNETVLIDGPAKIIIVEVRGRIVRLGIEAPATTKILRGELEPVAEERRDDVKGS